MPPHNALIASSVGSLEPRLTYLSPRRSKGAEEHTAYGVRMGACLELTNESGGLSKCPAVTPCPISLDLDAVDLDAV